MFEKLFNPETLTAAWEIVRSQFPLALWETVYVTVLATAFAFLLGLPLGVLLVTGDAGGIRPLPGWLMKLINTVINLLRSIPFLILMILVFPLTRLLVGTVVGTTASIVPLVIASFPFVARLAKAVCGRLIPISSKWPRVWVLLLFRLFGRCFSPKACRLCCLMPPSPLPPSWGTLP